MAVEKKVSELPTTSTAPQPTDVVVGDISGTTYKINFNQLALMPVNGGLGNGYYMGLGFVGFNAGEDLTQWDVVYLHSSGWKKAKANTAGLWPSRGLVISTVSSGNAATVLHLGVVRNTGWSWSAVNVSLYLSETAGGLSESAPGTTGACIQVVGFATGATEASFNFTGVYGEV